MWLDDSFLYLNTICISTVRRYKSSTSLPSSAVSLYHPKDFGISGTLRFGFPERMATSTEGLKFGFKKRVTTASPALPTPLESTPQDEGPPMQYITVVGDHSEAEAADCPKVIPAQQDSFRVGGKPSFVPSFVPDADESLRKKGLGEERFEKEVVVKTENEAVSYGLNLRQGADKHSIKGEDGVDVKEEVKSEHGLAGPITDTRSEREEQTYLEHMTALPDEAGIEVYKFCFDI